MISQTIQFNVTGVEADLLMSACIEQGISPNTAFQNFIQSLINKKTEQSGWQPTGQSTLDAINASKRGEVEHFNTIDDMMTAINE